MADTMGIPGKHTMGPMAISENVQVLYGFRKAEQARAYLNSSLFADDVARDLKPYLETEPMPGSTTLADSGPVPGPPGN